MKASETKRISKFLSLVLRHKPEAAKLVLDEQGWVSVDELLRKVNATGRLNGESLEYVVANNDKKRFAFNEDRTRIRANQGHSIDIELGYQPKEPPELLYHGTAEKFLDSKYSDKIIRPLNWIEILVQATPKNRDFVTGTLFSHAS